MSKKQLLAVNLTSDLVGITIGRSHVLQFLQDSPEWPTHESGEALKIVDKPEFLEQLCSYLMSEDEDGSTVIHRAIEQAALAMIEDGTETLEDVQSLGTSDDYESGEDEEED